MTKELRKAFMKRPQIESEYYIVNSAVENRDQLKKQNFLVNYRKRKERNLHHR